ncbi:hypothetical protein HK099_002804, partial [Clydaea vesicula]
MKRFEELKEKERMRQLEEKKKLDSEREKEAFLKQVRAKKLKLESDLKKVEEENLKKLQEEKIREERLIKQRKIMQRFEEDQRLKMMSPEERAHILAKREESDRAEKEAEEAKLRAEKEAEEAKLRAEKEAEEAKLRAEKEAEEARLKAERVAEEAQLKIKREAEKVEIRSQKEAQEKYKLEKEEILKGEKKTSGTNNLPLELNKNLNDNTTTFTMVGEKELPPVEKELPLIEKELPKVELSTEDLEKFEKRKLVLQQKKEKFQQDLEIKERLKFNQRLEKELIEKEKLKRDKETLEDKNLQELPAIPYLSEEDLERVTTIQPEPIFESEMNEKKNLSILTDKPVLRMDEKTIKSDIEKLFDDEEVRSRTLTGVELPKNGTEGIYSELGEKLGLETLPRAFPTGENTTREVKIKKENTASCCG